MDKNFFIIIIMRRNPIPKYLPLSLSLFISPVLFNPASTNIETDLTIKWGRKIYDYT